MVEESRRDDPGLRVGGPDATDVTPPYDRGDLLAELERYREIAAYRASREDVWAKQVEAVAQELAALRAEVLRLATESDGGEAPSASPEAISLALRFRAKVERQFSDELSAAVSERDGKLAALQAEADARLAALLETTEAVRTFEAECARLNAALADARRAFAEMGARVESAEARTRELERVCEERLAVIRDQAGAIEQIRTEAEANARALRAESEQRATMFNEALTLARDQKDELVRLRALLASTR